MDRIGKFIIKRPLARTAFASLFVAVDSDLEIEVAIKLFDPDAEALAAVDRGDANWLGKFIEEAQVLARMDHPHIAGIRDLCVDAEGQAYMVLPFIGATLAEERDGSEPVSAERALAVLCQLLSALAYMHDRGFVHRDIRPENILLAPDIGGAVKLADFGSVKRPESPFDDARLLPVDDRFAAPELLDDPARAGPPADVYAAVSLYFDLAAGAAVAGPALNAVLLGALAADPDERPATAGALLQALDGCAAPTSPPNRGATPMPIDVLELLTLNLKPRPESGSEPATDGKPVAPAAKAAEEPAPKAVGAMTTPRPKRTVKALPVKVSRPKPVEAATAPAAKKPLVVPKPKVVTVKATEAAKAKT
ncbi:MAG: serine/threonine-protein kinase [Rhodospirillales bacterium]